ncbi:MAG: GNAT family N-acetyltransferase [Pseudomonadota bacterium]
MDAEIADPAIVQPVLLRRATRPDMAALVRLYGQLMAAHDAPVDDAAAAAKIGARLDVGFTAILFERGEAVLGTAMWREMGDHVMLSTFVIAEGHRGRGLGTLLFARLVAESIGPDRPIRLEADGAPALGFWRAQGFVPFGTALRRDGSGDPA